MRNEREEKFLEADEIREMQEAAGPQLRAMILLGVNCGLGNLPVFTIGLQGDADLVGTVSDDLPLVHSYKLIAMGDEQVGQQE